MSKSNPSVEEQYTQWVYPEPILDTEEWKAKSNFQTCDPSLHHTILWPDQPKRSDLSILVAGCGTSQAAILAYNNPKASVIGVDLSDTSIDCTKRLVQKHNIKNLELHRMDLHDVCSFNKKFDLIYSTGVLHHLPDPQTSLKALSEVVSDDGVLCLMLYGKTLRVGVYMIQDALSLMGIKPTPEGLGFTKKLIASLPREHAVQAYIESAATDLVYDGGMVDTFLHKQDRAYTVPEILDFVKSGGLEFQGWVDNLMYYPDAYMPQDHPVYKKITLLPPEKQWAAVELIMQRIGMHGFLARKKGQKRERFCIDFDSPLFSDYIPSIRSGSSIKQEQGAVHFQRYGHILPLSETEQVLLKNIDGQRNVQNLCEIVANGNPCIKEDSFAFLKKMGRLGHLVYAIL